MSRGCTFYGLLNVCLNMVCLSETWDWGSFRVGVCHVSAAKTDKIRAEHIPIIGMVEFNLLCLFWQHPENSNVSKNALFRYRTQKL